MGINIIEWPSLQYCTMIAFGGDALQRKAMSHKSSFIIKDNWFRCHTEHEKAKKKKETSAYTKYC